jgi:hypothetical protein
MSVMVGPLSVVVRVKDLKSAPVDGDLVIMNLAKGNYVGLDKIGRRIWTVIEEPRRVADLCRQMTDEFSGEPEIIAQDVLAFLNELVAEGLIAVAEG